MRVASWCVAILFAAAPAGVAEAQRPPRPPRGVTLVRDVPYVADGHRRQTLDLYLPARKAGQRAEDEALPLVVWIHGGAWAAGSKEDFGAASLLTRGGYVVASVNYRLSHDAPFPAQVDDCRAAIRWLRDNAAKHRIDPDRIGVWGHSAGGHLAALLGTTDDPSAAGDRPGATSCRVQAICDFSGPTNLGLYGASRPGDILSRFLGGTVQDRPDVVSRADPASFATKDDPPFLLVHGENDPIVPVEHARRLESALAKANVEVELRIVRGGGHVVGGAEIAEAVGAFFDSRLKRADAARDIGR